jgi:hypothetical protein
MDEQPPGLLRAHATRLPYLTANIIEAAARHRVGIPRGSAVPCHVGSIRDGQCR